MACCGSSSPPTAPDYRGAAEQESNAQQRLNSQNLAANRPTQITPWGSTTWRNRGGQLNQSGYTAALDAYQRAAGLAPGGANYQPEVGADGSVVNTGAGGAARTGLRAPNVADYMSPDDWVQETSLDPRLQSQLDQEMELGNTLLGQARTSAGQGLDFSGLPELPDAGFGAVEQIRDAMMSRLRPRLDTQRETDLSRLRAIGIDEDDGATYASGMRPINERENDAEQQALLGAAGEYGNIFNRALRGRQQGISEILTQRNQPLNELAALRGAAGVEMPQMPGFAESGIPQTPDYTGATNAEGNYATDVYNANEARRAGLQQAGLTLVGTALGGPMGGYLASQFGGRARTVPYSTPGGSTYSVPRAFG